MKRKIVILLVLIIVLLLGLYVRSSSLYRWPREGATADEYAWPFLGISLLNEGVPVSWSPHPQYEIKQTYHNPRGASFPLVKPYLEHPPLFGIVVGLFAKLNGANTFDDIEIRTVRPLALLLGIVSIGAVFLLTYELYGVSVGLIAAALYAVIPTVVAGSRLLQNENFFIPLFLATLYLLARFIRTKSTLAFGLMLFLIYALPLAKIPWITACLAVVGILLTLRRWRESIVVGLVGVSAMATYIAYGMYFDGDLFVKLMRLQTARYDINFDALYALLTPLVTDREYLDGWIYMGWISIILVAAAEFKKHRILLGGFLAYFFVFLFAIPNEAGHGWYRYPFYPFLTIATALFIKNNFSTYIVPTIGFFLVTGLAVLETVWKPIFGFSYLIYRFFLILSFSPLLGTLSLSDRAKHGVKLISYLMLVLIYVGTIVAALSYNEQ